jgi:hypothetical protein
MRRAARGILLLAGLFLTASVLPQATPEPGLRLQLGRDFGYYASGEMQGAFTLSVAGVDDPVSVEYLIDGGRMALVAQAPFRHSFSTSAYAPGTHTLQAVAVTAAGAALRSPLLTFTFLTAEEAQRAAMRLIVPLGGVILGLAALGILGTVLLTARPGTARPGQYGLAGGAICPRCGRPFARHVLSLNLVTGKLERCPSCRAWSVVPAAGREALRAAEARAASGESAAPSAPADAESLQRQLEDSRFTDEG